MNVGDYVRTKKGIAKIIDKLDNERFSYPGAWVTDTYLEIYEDTEYIYDEDIIKSSPQIIDLIEAGDYVNGKKVIDTYNDYIFDYSEEFKVIRFSETDILNNSNHIKTIVTHEQMEAMQYRVEE